jgi:hypothetical protein
MLFETREEVHVYRTDIEHRREPRSRLGRRLARSDGISYSGAGGGIRPAIVGVRTNVSAENKRRLTDYVPFVKRGVEKVQSLGGDISVHSFETS